MKRRVFDLRSLTGTGRHTQTVTRVPGFVIVDFTAHEVARPLDVPFGDRTIRVLDHGFRWVRAHPTGTSEGVIEDALTVMLNAAGQPRQLYVDIHTGEGVGEGGLPWHDDLYLDVVADWQVSQTHIIDAEELADAVEAGLVSPTLAEAAWTHARQVEAQLWAGTYAALDVLRRYLEDPCT